MCEDTIASVQNLKSTRNSIKIKGTVLVSPKFRFLTASDSFAEDAATSIFHERKLNRERERAGIRDRAPLPEL